MSDDVMNGRLIVALDVPGPVQAEAVVRDLGDHVSFYKIGYQLAFCGGLDLARDLVASGKRIFLDLKLLDIDNTVARGVESIAGLGVSMLTIHAYPKAMRAAVDAARGSQLCLLAVTVLTSMDEKDVSEAGYGHAPADLVRIRADQAVQAGMGGVVCAAPEARAVRDRLGPELAVVTPGIRGQKDPHGDQKRVSTPRQAILAGASHLVVGRPITGAPDRRAAAQAILNEMNGT